MYYVLFTVGIVGEMDQKKDYVIWTHKKFNIGYHENQVDKCINYYIELMILFARTQGSN